MSGADFAEIRARVSAEDVARNAGVIVKAHRCAYRAFAVKERGAARIAALLELSKGALRVNVDLKAQKLTAEIALKESQADLHKLKTAIAEGKYLPVEEVKLDYEQFFVTFKKFALAIPQRVGAIVAGYGDPVIARKVEADINHEITEMLSTFVVAAQVRPETATR